MCTFFIQHFKKAHFTSIINKIIQKKTQKTQKKQNKRFIINVLNFQQVEFIIGSANYILNIKKFTS